MRLIVLILLCPFFLLGQPPTERYTSELFSVTETNDVLFSTAVPQPVAGGGFYEFITGLPLNADESSTANVDLYMDIFEPTGDTLSQRPLIIISFGGGFLSGSRDHWSMRLLCQELASRGFVTASIDYRLGMNIFDEDLSKRAVYRGLQDLRSAVRFFRADANGSNTYRIDPNKIFAGGHSSGAFMAIHNAYLDLESERPPSTYAWLQDGDPVLDQGCLDCAGDNQSYDGRCNAIFSLAGAIGHTYYMETATDPEIVMFHSEDDGTVPYTSGDPFSSILILVIGDDLPTVYGSQPISERADSIGLPYEFYSYSSRGHSVHENGNSELYDDIVPGIADWFVEQELKPKSRSILGDTTACLPSGLLTYDYARDSNTYYNSWLVEDGVLSMPDPYSHLATVQWSPTGTAGSVSVVPYSKWDAKGDTTQLSVQLMPAMSNTYTNTLSAWQDPTSWSLGRLPLACDDVVVPSSASALILTTLDDTEINSLSLGQNHSLLVPAAQTLTIFQKTEASTLPTVLLDGQLNNDGQLRLFQKGINHQLIVRDGTLINTGTIEAEDR